MTDPRGPLLPPSAYGLVADIAARPASRRVQVIIGTAGSGKTAVLQEIRRVYRRAGVSPAQNLSPDDHEVLIIDNGHRLSDADLVIVATLARAGNTQIVVAGEPRPRKPEWAGAVEALSWDTPPVLLSSLTPAQITEIAARMEAPTPDPPAVDWVHHLTGGLFDLVTAALTEAPDRQRMGHAAARAMRERLFRLDEQVLATVALLTMSAPIGTAEIAAVLDVNRVVADRLTDAARGTGLTDGPHPFTARVRRSALSVLGESRGHALAHALLDGFDRLGPIPPEFAEELAEQGVVDDRLIDPIMARATAEPERREALCRLAIRSGADPVATQVRAAEMRALAGDVHGAATAIDAVWTDLEAPATDPGLVVRAVRISAGAAVDAGNSTRAAELYDWQARRVPDPLLWGADAAMAGVVHLAAGDPTTAGRLLDELARHAAPNPVAGAAVNRALLQGLLQSLDRGGSTVLTTLARAVGLAGTAQPGIAPDVPAAIAAIAALQVGEVARARSMLSRTPPERWPAAHRTRRCLLTAWVLMVEGDDPAATAMIDRIEHVPGTRDQLGLAALRVALARRSGDLGELRAAWDGALGPLAEYTVDLFGLLFVGELWVAAARLRVTHEIMPVVDDALALLAALGNPVYWSAALHWYGVHAAIAGDSPAALVPHAQALAEGAQHSGYARALARAGRAWVLVLGGTVDPDEVDAACHELDAVGHGWDATRLAGQAALHAADQRVTATMLQLARSLRTHQVAAHESAPVGLPPKSPVSILTDREREVVDLMLLGLTYRDIGERLFISAKTVEHHVARIRRRIGAQTRSEMLSLLRSMTAGVDA